jgi:hypothetical protein
MVSPGAGPGGKARGIYAGNREEHKAPGRDGAMRPMRGYQRDGGFLAAFGMRVGQLTMRSSSFSSSTSSSLAPTRPRTEIPAW